MSTSPE
jgi:hypothetical protein